MCKVINLADVGHKNNRDVVLNTIAHKLNTTKDLINETHMHVTAKLMADVNDGYIVYVINGIRRAALVVNVVIGNGKFPFIYHADDGNSDPVGLLFKDVEFEYLGSFKDYIRNDANVMLYHSVADHIPMELNGIGIIQAVEMAKCHSISSSNELGIRRIARDTIRLLSIS